MCSRLTCEVGIGECAAHCWRSVYSAELARAGGRLARLLPAVLTLLMSNSIDAFASPPPPQPNAAEIALALRKLGVVGSVLYVAAHPDDENTNLFAYLSKERLVRTAYLSLTRGDGGQNLIGAEQGAELGVIRTQELLAARRLDGAEQFFTRARDFGYSKNPEETLRIWGKDAVLADIVLVIRRFRPDVIVTRFSPELTDTHGHHTASAQLTLEAFHKAADKTFHPEQLSAEVRLWQARRIIWNRSSWSLKPGEDLSGFLKMDVNAYNPLLGISCGELAADSRSMHKSQGFGVARTRDPIIEYFKSLDETDAPSLNADSILAGLDFSWARFKGSAALRRLVDRAQREFLPVTPHTLIPTLLRIDQALDTVPDAGWREKKKTEVRDLILACAGLFSRGHRGGLSRRSGQHDRGHGHDHQPLARQVQPARCALLGWRDRRPTQRRHDPRGQTAWQRRGKEDACACPRTCLSPRRTGWPLPPDPGVFRVQDPSLIGLPESEPPCVDFVFEIDGAP
jgi:LmbE family N-acetylglucosaminyl deacetylase